MRAFIGLCLLLAFARAWAAGCEPVPEGALELSIAEVGTVYFLTLEPGLSEGRLELGGGVCVAGAGGWLLRSERLAASGLETAPTFEASEVQLEISGWTIEAEHLRYAEAKVELSRVRFRSREVQGEAEQAVLQTATGALELQAVSAQGRAYRVQGERARLEGERLFFEDALATTCICEASALYVIRAPEASYDLSREELAIQDGRLLIGSVSVTLDDLILSPERLADLSFPIRVEYVAGSETQQGTGLGIRIPELPVTETLSLELGLLGLDVEYPLKGVLLAHYQDERVSFDLGTSGDGPLAEFALREPLTPWLDARFALRSNYWSVADYLHDGLLGLEARHSLTLWRGDQLYLTPGVFIAASSQQPAGGAVQGARLGAYLGGRYRAPPSSWGQFALDLRLEASHYPHPVRAAQSQFGLRLAPSWRANLGPLQLSASYTGQVVAGSSPFSSSLDRLEPVSQIAATARVEGELTPELSGDFGVDARYDFLAAAPADVWSERFTQLTLSGSLRWEQGERFVASQLSAQLAPLLNAELREDGPSYLEGDLELGGEDWQLGLAARLDLLEPDPLSKLEASVAFPLDFGDVRLKPFLAFDVLPMLRDEFPRISGHGLELTWRSCCGTIVLGYRQEENNFSTSFALKFDEP